MKKPRPANFNRVISISFVAVVCLLIICSLVAIVLIAAGSLENQITTPHRATVREWRAADHRSARTEPH